LFRKAAYYTDWSIHKFMEAAQKQPWYDQTLFIFVADHGNRLPKLYKDAHQFEKYRIPLLFYGNAISKKLVATRNSRIGSQTDIVPTLLGQLGIESTAFQGGKDLLNPSSKQFAFYCYNEGMTWITPEGSLRYVTATETPQFKENQKNTLSKELPYAKSYLQALLEDYAKK